MSALASVEGADVQAPVRPWSVFWVASIAVFLVSLDGTVLFAAFGALQEGFPATSAAALSWVLNAYTVVFAAMLIPAGGLADRYGRKRIFVNGLTLFLAASVACALAPDIYALVGARVLQAVGAALLTPASLSLVLDAFPLSQRALAVSLWGAVGALAAAVGPGLGSVLIDHLGWPWAFYLNLPLGLLSFWRGGALLRETASPLRARPLDWPGMILLLGAVVTIALLIVQFDAPDWTAGIRLGYAGVAGVLLAAFLVRMYRTPAPLVEPALFANGTYRFVNLATLSFGIAFAMMFFGFFRFLTGVWGYSLSLAGMAVTPGPLMVIPTAIVVGRLAGRYGHRPFLVAGAGVYAASGLCLLLMPGSEPAYLLDWLPGLLLSGVGVGMVLPSLAGAAVARLPAAHYAVGSAFNQATRQIGAVIGVAITVLVLGEAADHHGAFVPLYLGQVGLALATGVLCLGVRTRPNA